jgi:hypothetical protein
MVCLSAFGAQTNHTIKFDRPLGCQKRDENRNINNQQYITKIEVVSRLNGMLTQNKADVSAERIIFGLFQAGCFHTIYVILLEKFSQIRPITAKYGN